MQIGDENIDTGKGGILLFLLLFVLFYAFLISFDYIEGDDASTIAYHVFGRDRAVQPPYNAYHGMFDRFLAIFSPREELLKIVSIGTSTIFNVISILLAARIARGWAPNISNNLMTLFCLLVPFMCPELIFLGAVYNPTSVAMALLFFSHLMVRSAQSGKGQVNTRYLLSAVLFGIGVSFRWNAILYGLIIVLDLLFRAQWHGQRKFGKEISSPIIWGLGAVLFSVTFVLISVGNPTEIIAVFFGSMNFLEKTPISLRTRIIETLGFLTPAFIFFIFVGIWTILRKRKYMLITFILIAIAANLSINQLFNPKYSFVFLPIYLTICLHGLKIIQESASRIVLTGIGIAIIVPWIIGVQIDSSATRWGPGFRMSQKEKFNQDRGRERNDLGIMNYLDDAKIVYDVGNAVATQEGPRPLWGYYYAIFDGHWKKFIKARAFERQEFIGKALSQGLPIITLTNASAIIVGLADRGFRTADSQNSSCQNFGCRRKFSDGKNAIEVYRVKKLENLLRLGEKELSDYMKSKNVRKVLVYSDSSKRITQLRRSFVKTFQSSGPFTGEIDFELINAATQNLGR